MVIQVDQPLDFADPHLTTESPFFFLFPSPECSWPSTKTKRYTCGNGRELHALDIQSCLLGFGVLGRFWGVQISSQEVFGCLGIMKQFSEGCTPYLPFPKVGPFSASGGRVRVSVRAFRSSQLPLLWEAVAPNPRDLTIGYHPISPNCIDCNPLMLHLFSQDFVPQ